MAPIAAAVFAAAVAAASPAATTFRDRTGDVEGGGGPDIVAVTVSSTATAVTFRVRFAKAPPLQTSTREQWIDMLLLGIDVPPLGPKPTRSGWRGVDYMLGAHGSQKTITVVKATRSAKGAGFTRLGSVPLVTSGATLSFSILRSRLGSPASLDFTLAAGRETATPEQGGGSDYAPQSGTFHFRLAR
jgi:hypothetical protein